MGIGLESWMCAAARGGIAQSVRRRDNKSRVEVGRGREGRDRNGKASVILMMGVERVNA